MTLNGLPEGAVCRVLRLENSPRAAARLKDLGLVPGTLLSVQRYAPMGDPMEIHLRGYSLAIRRKEAGKIIVRLTGLKGGGTLAENRAGRQS